MMMTEFGITLYGIKQCDTVRKARKWLNAEAIPFTFHDFREGGITPDHVLHWLEFVTIADILNRKSTTWRGLSADEKAVFYSPSLDAQVNLLVTNPTLIKRPVLHYQPDQYMIGFAEDKYAKLRALATQ